MNSTTRDRDHVPRRTAEGGRVGSDGRWKGEGTVETAADEAPAERRASVRWNTAVVVTLVVFVCVMAVVSTRRFEGPGETKRLAGRVAVRRPTARENAAIGDGTLGARPACESPVRTDEPRAGTERYPGASSSPVRGCTDDPGSVTSESERLRMWSPHGRSSPWLGGTRARGTNRTTSRARDWTTGSFPASTISVGRYAGRRRIREENEFLGDILTVRGPAMQAAHRVIRGGG